MNVTRASEARASCSDMIYSLLGLALIATRVALCLDLSSQVIILELLRYSSYFAFISGNTGFILILPLPVVLIYDSA